MIVDGDDLRRRLDAAWRLDPEESGGGPEPFMAEMRALLADAEALGEPESLFRVLLGYTYSLGFRGWKDSSREVTGEWLGLLRRCLLMWHAEPHRYDEDYVTAMWTQFYRLLDVFIRIFPEPADRVRRLVDELERYCPPTRPGFRYALDDARLHLAARRGDVAEVERWWTRLRTQEPPREHMFPDGLASVDATMWARLGHPGRAIAALAPVLTGRIPTRDGDEHEDVLLMPYLLTGRVGEAVAVHQRTYTRSGMKFGEVAAHLEFCARTGNEERGLDVLHRNFARIGYHCDSVDGMWTAAAAALLCRRVVAAGLDREWVWECGCADPGCETLPLYTYAKLGQDLRWHATRFAEHMDGLNGTPHLGERIDALLHAEPVVDRLELPPAAAPARHRAGPPRSPHLDATDDAGLLRALDLARAADPGTSRIVLTQRVLQNALVGGATRALVEARFALLDDLLPDGWELWSTDLFSCLVELFRLHEARPTLLGADRLAAMWRAVPVALDRALTLPGTHLRQVRAFLDTAERHQRPGTGDARHVRWFRTGAWARAGDAEAARAAWEHWCALPPAERRTTSADVLRAVQWWLDLGRDRWALETAETLPAGSDRSRLLPALLRAGRADEAHELHERTYRTVTGAPEVAAHLQFCARTGRLEHGREIIGRVLGLYHVADDEEFAFDRLRAYAGAVLLGERLVAAGLDEPWTWPADACCPAEDGWSHARLAAACRRHLALYARRWEELLGTDFHTRAVTALADGR
ncbi:hypothetical protein ACSNOI_35585 [Actinomadura kijaniata]|uniref:hypothetical protein n=1 Tax=Actinomadura kijaniata TaxID=46161 RepID=UPI003F1AEACC